MITTEEVSDWAEHQNIEGMEKVREQNRLRKQKQRENQKLLSASNDSHATDIDKEIRNKNIYFYADKPQKKSKQFVPPTLEDVTQYISEKKLSVDTRSF